MNQQKIGKFISENRKKQGLTQAQLAEKLGVSDRAVSKWENGKSMPDVSIMLSLCELLSITINELLIGENISMEHHEEKINQLLLDAVRQKQETDKKMLAIEIVITVFAMTIFLGACAFSYFVDTKLWIRILVGVLGFVFCLIGGAIAIKIEQTAGYYECKHCHNKYIPSYLRVFFAMHVNRTRYMKCPKCKKRNWQKKIIEKE